MGGRGGGRGGRGRRGGYKGRHAKTALSRKKARQAASRGYAPAGSDPGNLARAAVAHGESGWGWARDSGYGSYAQPRDQIPGTAEYTQRIRREEAKKKVTKAESGFGDTFKKAMAIGSFVTAPGIVSGANLINTLRKKDTDYSKAFAPGSAQSIANTWSPQNLSKTGFGMGTMNPGDWNMASLTPTDARTLMGIIKADGPMSEKQKAIDTMKKYAPKTLYKNFPGLVQNNQWSPGNLGGEIGQVAYAGNYGLGIGQNEVGQVTRSNDPIAQQNRDNLSQAVARLSAQNPALAKASDRNWSRGLGTDTRAVRSATARGGGARPLPTLASQAPTLKAAQDQQAQAGNLTISDYLKQAQEQSAQNRAALSQLQTGRTDLTAQIEALKKQYGEDVDLTGLQKQSGEFQTVIDQRTADLSAYDQAVRGNVVKQQQMWATPQRTWGVKAQTSEYKSPLQQFGRKARQETKKIQTQTPTISNLAATWGNLPILNV